MMFLLCTDAANAMRLRSSPFIEEGKSYEKFECITRLVDIYAEEELRVTGITSAIAS